MLKVDDAGPAGFPEHEGLATTCGEHRQRSAPRSAPVGAAQRFARAALRRGARSERLHETRLQASGGLLEDEAWVERLGVEPDQARSGLRGEKSFGFGGGQPGQLVVWKVGSEVESDDGSQIEGQLGQGEERRDGHGAAEAGAEVAAEGDEGGGERHAAVRAGAGIDERANVQETRNGRWNAHRSWPGPGPIVAAQVACGGRQLDAAAITGCVGPEDATVDGSCRVFVGEALKRGVE